MNKGMPALDIRDQKWLVKLDTLIYTTMSDTNLSTQQIAEALNMSRSQLHRKLQILRGGTPKVYIQDMRFDYA
jgi:AraC-like DNA-binding protein